MVTKGKFYSVGTGPGDPKLLTVAALETIENADVIAVPDSGNGKNAVLEIVKEYVGEKNILYCPMAMTRDKKELARCHEDSCKMLQAELDGGKNIAFLTLGDPSVYSTTMYVHNMLKGKGYSTQMIPGVPSFCAAAAALDLSLCEGGQALHILPASYGGAEEGLALDGNKVLMKSGKSILKVKQFADVEKNEVYAVERCGMEGEKIHTSLDTVDETTGYFCVMIVKEKKQ